MSYRFGIDIGGTNIKIAVLDDSLCVKETFSFSTNIENDFGKEIGIVIDRINHVINVLNINKKDIEYMGFAIPGLVKSKKGPITFAPNIKCINFNPYKLFSDTFGCTIEFANDADCAAIAEYALGAGNKFDSFLMLTLGTAVGTAAVKNGQIFNGLGAFGGEFGHIPLVHNGFPCSCGIRGCFQQYGSARALIRITKEKLINDSHSLLNSIKNIHDSQVDCSDIFYAYENGDKIAKSSVDEYVRYLCEGVAGLIHILRPESIIIGGGLSESTFLIKKIKDELSSFIYAHEYTGVPNVVPAVLGTYAGSIGAGLSISI